MKSFGGLGKLKKKRKKEWNEMIEMGGANKW